MAGEGYYRSDGLQNSGTALTIGNQNVYMFTGTNFMQIYPREIPQTLDNNNFGGFSCQTYRSTGSWRDCAYQGAKSIGYSSSNMICYGHIIPSSVPRYNHLLSVEYVRIGFQPHHCGQHGLSRDLVFRVGLNGDAEPPMDGSYTYTLGVRQDQTYQTAEGYAGSALANLFYTLITRGNRLMLYNGETTVDKSASYWDGTGYGSRNYAAIESFEVQELRLKYQP